MVEPPIISFIKNPKIIDNTHAIVLNNTFSFVFLKSACQVYYLPLELFTLPISSMTLYCNYNLQVLYAFL